MLKTELITRVIISLFLVFIVGKIIASLLQVLMGRINTTGGNKKNHDIDHMIERQKEILRAKLGLTNSPVAHEGETSNKSGTESAYQNLMKNGNDLDKSNAKKMLELFDHLQWGDGKIYAEIQQHLKQKWNISIEKTDVGHALKHILAQNLLLKISPSGPASFEECCNLIELYLFIRHLGITLDEANSPWLDQIARQSKVQNVIIVRSIDLLWSVMLEKDEKESRNAILKYGLVNRGNAQKTYEAALNRLVVPKRRPEFWLPDKLLNKIREYAVIFDALAPIPPLSHKQDIAGALKVFGLAKMSTIEEVKKIYKDLANRKHPDKLMGKGLADEWIKLASDNFTTIQLAYDILRGHKD